MVLHGGPGGGIQTEVLRFFDLDVWHVVMYDQRGCGKSETDTKSETDAKSETDTKSTAGGNAKTETDADAILYKNTTWDLVRDIELLRQTLNIKRWTVFGGSWGTTLALAYADKHMNRIAGLVLRGVSLLEPWENEWMYTDSGAAKLFPEAWSAFTQFVPKTKGCNMTRVFKPLLKSKNRATRRKAVRAWTTWESALSTLEPTDSVSPSPPQMALLENHYFSHGGWLRPGQLLSAARRIPRSVPVVIIQGRYDMVCPPLSAYKVATACRHAKLIMTVAGHSAFEPETAAALAQTLRHLGNLRYQ